MREALAVFWLHCLRLCATDDSDPITCGSSVKITSRDTGYDLNSEDKQLNGGSGQQLVTFVKDQSTHDTLWRIRPAEHGQDAEYPETANCQLAEPIKCDSEIRLTHVSTNRNLHSHEVKSILSNQQEVTGYGTGDGLGDGGDNWKVLCDTKYWKRGSEFRLRHSDTSKYLGTSKNVEFNQQTCGHNCPIMGHLEAFGRNTGDSFTYFKIEQGIHLSK